MIGAIPDRGVFVRAAVGHGRQPRRQPRGDGAGDPLQCEGVSSTLVYSGVMTLIILMAKLTIGLRVTDDEEQEGLDIVLHGEQVF